MASSSPYSVQMRPFAEKMRSAGLAEFVVQTFAQYFEKVKKGETGLIHEKNIQPLLPEEVRGLEDLDRFEKEGKKYRSQAVYITLNGGLGTSMGLTKAKSLLRAKFGRSFLEIILDRAYSQGVTQVLMNSFSTDADTRAEVDRVQPEDLPEMFLQHKFPKILADTLGPVTWPRDPELEWNPPGHGDIYVALHTSGMLDRLLDQGVRYAFICNCDNLGASLSLSLLGYFAQSGFPFMMEVARRSPSDIKGGHLARHESGRLLLREIAQCPKEELGGFQDIGKYRYFNTNNLWVDLLYLKEFIKREKVIRLPMILNPKFLNPRDEATPMVYQVETAMGSAIFLFPGAAVVRVPQSRMIPVKTTGDLLAVRSDCYMCEPDQCIFPNPDRREAGLMDRVDIRLDDRYYRKVDDFEARFGPGVPSLVYCESFEVIGDVRFEGVFSAKGRVTIVNEKPRQALVPKNSHLEGEVILA